MNLDKDYFLWQQFKKGDENAFYHLYDQYVDVLYRFGRQYTMDENLIKDSIHDLFLDLYKCKGRLSDIHNTRSYLFSALRHRIYREKTRNHLFIAESPPDHLVFPIEDTLIASETEEENSRILNQVLKALTSRQREALSLKFKNNLTYPEIAQILGISVASARTIVYRSLKQLRGCLKGRIPLPVC